MYPGNQPLFFAPPEHEKVAGYKMPANPKFWQSEVIRYLKSQHPYLPLEDSEIDIRRIDVGKGAAVGSVIIGKEIAIPIIIGRPRPGADPELAPMDVFFHKGRYRFLDPEAIKQLAHKPQVGEPEQGRKSRAVGGNPYIGDVTGDATPLEYSGQASPFAGPFDGTKVSMDISTELLPEWMLKESSPLREQMKEKATTFGVTGAVGGAVRGAITGKGDAKKRAVNALRQAGLGVVAGTAAGASLPVARKLLGHARKESREETKKIKDVLRRELNKSASLDQKKFTIGLDLILEAGHLATMSKEAYLEPNDISNFRQILAANPHILQGSANNLQLVEIVARRGPDTPGIRANPVKNPNIMQVYAKPDGSVCIKFSGGPETRTTPAELKAALGDRYKEVMSKIRSGNVFMEHDGVQQMTWDAVRPAAEAKPINGDGLYSARTLAGESVVGMVITAIMGFDGKTLPMKLFVTPEGKYAMTGELFGVKMSSKHRLPSQLPNGGQTGVFVNYVHGTPISTLPLRMVSVRRVKPVDGDVRVVYLVQNPVTGERFALSPVRRAQGFERMRVVDPGVQSVSDGADVYYMPGDSEWVELKTPVRMAESEEQLSKLSSVDDSTHVRFAAGLWHIDAVVGTHSFIESGEVKKHASFHDLDEPSAREILVSMGMPVEEAISFMNEVHGRQGMDRGVKIAGLHSPQIQGFEVIETPKVEYDSAVLKLMEDVRPDVELLKAAAESGHPETLDSILSLEFITPQNLRYFTDNIADFEEAATRLAALLIAVRLGMPHVPEQPVKDALEGLSRTINKLMIMKSAIDNKNERTATSQT